MTSSSLDTAQWNAPADRRRTRWIALTTVLVFAIAAGVAAVMSAGFLEADGCTHYLYDRFALKEHHFLLNVWGRPFKTCLYAFPASWFGLQGVRFTSILLACVTSWLTLLIARGQGYRRPELAVILLLGQPLFFLHGFSELTELPFAFLTALAMLCYQRRGFAEMCLIVGLMPLSRPEGFAMLLPAAVAVVLHRRFYLLPILFVPLVVWNHLGWVAWGKPWPWWRWLPDNWPYAQSSVYGAGSVLKFLALLPMMISPLAFPFMWIGMGQGLRLKGAAPVPVAGAGNTPVTAAPTTLEYGVSPSRGASLPPWLRHFLSDHRARCQFVIAALPLGLLFCHSILHALGKMASNGELRYLLCLAPLWALCSASGWEWTCETFRIRRPALLASIAVLLPVGLNVYYPVVPLKFDTNWQDAEVVAAVLREDWKPKTESKLMLSHPGVYYFLDLSITDPDRVIEWSRAVILKRPAHTVLVWDDVYGVYNADERKSVTLDEIVGAGWHEKTISGLQESKRWRMFVSDPE